jgi:hypothetical protein
VTAGAEIRAVLTRHLNDSNSSVSIGSFGAIAECYRSASEPFEIDESQSSTVVTERCPLHVTSRIL